MQTKTHREPRASARGSLDRYMVQSLFLHLYVGIVAPDVPVIVFHQNFAIIGSTLDRQRDDLLHIHHHGGECGNDISLFHYCKTHPALRHPSRDGGEGWRLRAIGSFF